MPTMRNNTDNKQQSTVKMITKDEAMITVLPVKVIDIMTVPSGIVKHVYFCISPFSLN